MCKLCMDMCASVTEHRGWHSRGCAQVSVSGVIACALGPCVYMHTCEHARARTSAECLFTPGVSECAHWDDRHGLVSVCACAHVDVAVGCPVEACGCPRRLQHRQRGARGAERRVQLCMTRSARPERERAAQEKLGKPGRSLPQLLRKRSAVLPLSPVLCSSCFPDAVFQSLMFAPAVNLLFSPLRKYCISTSTSSVYVISHSFSTLPSLFSYCLIFLFFLQTVSSTLSSRLILKFL